MFLLDGKVAVITGAAGGIGYATARRFLEAGTKVVVGDLNDVSDKAETIDAVFQHTDVSDEEQVEALMQRTIHGFGKFDVTVNNADLMIVGNSIIDEENAPYPKQFDVNAMAVSHGIRHATTRMNPDLAEWYQSRRDARSRPDLSLTGVKLIFSYFGS